MQNMSNPFARDPLEILAHEALEYVMRRNATEMPTTQRMGEGLTMAVDARGLLICENPGEVLRIMSAYAAERVTFNRFLAGNLRERRDAAICKETQAR
jgi:hypothetical protein